MNKILLFCAVGALSFNTLRNSLEKQANSPTDLPALRPAELSADQTADYQKMASVYIVNFKKYQSIIGDVNSSETSRDIAMLNAEDMFLSPNQNIEIGWISGGTLQKKVFKVKDYFQRFRQRSRQTYSQTKVSNFKPHEEVEGFSEQERDVYKATYRFFQKFEGFAGNSIVYSDETTKDIEMYAMPNKGEVKLGNIHVVDITNVVNKSRGAGGEHIEGLPAGNVQLWQDVQNSRANVVRILGTRGTLLKKLPLKSFKEKCEFGEFDAFEFEGTRNGAAIVRMK